jgi:hypothetical protein
METDAKGASPARQAAEIAQSRYRVRKLRGAAIDLWPKRIKITAETNQS